MGKRASVETTSMRITLTEPELLCLKNLKNVGCFRSYSSTIGEVLRFVQALRDDAPNITALETLGPRFGIRVTTTKST